jgi:uncharacterized membrane protein
MCRRRAAEPDSGQHDRWGRARSCDHGARVSDIYTAAPLRRYPERPARNLAGVRSLTPKELAMSELVVVAFDDPADADRVLDELRRMQTEYLVDLDDAVVAVRPPDGKVELKQSVKLAAAGAASGGLYGGLFGSLIGLIFLNPLVGFAIGGALGAGTGAISGSLVDYGINDDFIRSIANNLKPGTSALFALVRKAQPDKVLKELSRFKGRVLRTSLSPEQEARLQQALSQASGAPA